MTFNYECGDDICKKKLKTCVGVLCTLEHNI